MAMVHATYKNGDSLGMVFPARNLQLFHGNN